jgi:5-methyltetrahydropteroyltriglutamate--homocysteine methyltransferase
MTAASPGVLARFVANRHYGSEDAYLAALADAMRVEYEAIVNAGFVLQIDCPDMASSRNTVYQTLSDDEFARIADRNVEMLNHATRGLPSERMRMHICWGNYEGPHTYDIPFTKIAAACFRARPQGLSFEGANPRHEHEWADFAKAKIPDDKILIPGVIDSTSNFVEHPRLVAQRIERFTAIVGRARVIAGVDCGFGTFATKQPVATSVVWSKLRALAEGAALASA